MKFIFPSFYYWGSTPSCRLSPDDYGNTGTYCVDSYYFNSSSVDVDDFGSVSRWSMANPGPTHAPTARPYFVRVPTSEAQPSAVVSAMSLTIAATISLLLARIIA